MLIIFISSCSSNNKRSINDSIKINISDSIIYIVSQNTEKIIEDSILSCKYVTYCYLLSDINDNTTSFTFPYIEQSEFKNKRLNLLITKSNRFLKIKNKFLPIIFPADIDFSSIPEDSIKFIDDSKFASVKIDYSGMIVDLMIY